VPSTAAALYAHVPKPTPPLLTLSDSADTLCANVSPPPVAAVNPTVAAAAPPSACARFNAPLCDHTAPPAPQRAVATAVRAHAS
jgi:hypothetical protein